MTKEEIADLLGRTREAAANGQFELYKVSQTSTEQLTTRSGSASDSACPRNKGTCPAAALAVKRPGVCHFKLSGRPSMIFTPVGRSSITARVTRQNL